MAKTGAGIQLGRLLRSLRDQVEWSTAQAARAVGVSASTYRKYEAATTIIPLAHFIALLTELGRVRNPSGDIALQISEDERQQFLDLRNQADQPVWWSGFGLNENASQFLGFESMATAIDVYESSFVFGPFQTLDYAHAVIEAVEPPETEPSVIEKYVSLRLRRQEQVYQTASRPDLRVVLDEAVIRRPVGGPRVMADQLRRLAELDSREELRVLPLAASPHVGMKGAFHVYTFPDGFLEPALYVESVQRNFYVDDPRQVGQASLDYQRLWDASLSNKASKRLCLTVAKEMEGQ